MVIQQKQLCLQLLYLKNLEEKSLAFRLTFVIGRQKCAYLQLRRLGQISDYEGSFFEYEKIFTYII